MTFIITLGKMHKSVKCRNAYTQILCANTKVGFLQLHLCNCGFCSCNWKYLFKIGLVTATVTQSIKIFYGNSNATYTNSLSQSVQLNSYMGNCKDSTWAIPLMALKDIVMIYCPRSSALWLLNSLPHIPLSKVITA